MAFNGAGVFNLIYNFVQDRLNSIKPAAERFHLEFQNVADGLSNLITRDGQTTILTDIPWNNKRITGLGDATGATDALNRQTGDARYLQAANTANAAQIRGNVSDKPIDTDGLWDAMGPVSLGTTLTGAVTVDLATGVNFSGTLTGNVSLANPTNPKPGQAGLILLSQDATGGRTITFGTNWKFEDATAPLLTTTANTSSAITYYVHTSSFIIASVARGL